MSKEPSPFKRIKLWRFLVAKGILSISYDYLSLQIRQFCLQTYFWWNSVTLWSLFQGQAQSPSISQMVIWFDFLHQLNFICSQTEIFLQNFPRTERVKSKKLGVTTNPYIWVICNASLCSLNSFFWSCRFTFILRCLIAKEKNVEIKFIDYFWPVIFEIKFQNL